MTARSDIETAEDRMLDAAGFVGGGQMIEERERSFALRFDARNADTELEVGYDAGAEEALKTLDDLVGEGDQLLAPHLILDLDNEAIANELHGAGTRGDLRPHGTRPRFSRQILGANRVALHFRQ